MSITQIYSPDDFFVSVDRNKLNHGQICWVPVPQPDPVPRILDIERKTPEEHEQINFLLRSANQHKDFKQRDRSLPVKYLNLRSNEELLAQRAKKRPAIILALGVECFPDITKLLRQKGKKHQQQDCLFVIPCYSTQQDEYGSGYIPEMVARIQCLMYRQFFYLPQSAAFSEVVARFDRIQVVTDNNPVAIEPSNICLSEDIFNLFLAMFIFCISGKTNEDLEALKEMVREAYPED